MNPELIIYALFGLVVGSFLNVCIYRIPLGRSVVFPGSGCPRCGRAIRFYDNIPVLSWVLLLGKCRACKGPISFQYPLVELLTGLAFYLCALAWGFQPPTWVNSLFLGLLVILVFTDYNHQILPDVLTKPGIVLGVLLCSFQKPEFYSDILSVRAASILRPGNPEQALPWIGSITGAVIGGGLLLMVGLGYEKLRKREGLGFGDVKMMAMVGSFIGWPLALLTIFAGSLLGSLLGVFLMLFHGRNLQTKLAFGVFLGIGAAFSLFCGLPFLDWYKNIFR